MPDFLLVLTDSPKRVVSIKHIISIRTKACALQMGSLGQHWRCPSLGMHCSCYQLSFLASADTFLSMRWSVCQGIHPSNRSCRGERGEPLVWLNVWPALKRVRPGWCVLPIWRHGWSCAPERCACVRLMLSAGLLRAGLLWCLGPGRPDLLISERDYDTNISNWKHWQWLWNLRSCFLDVAVWG